MSLQTRELYEFGNFRLDAVRRLVIRYDEPLRVHSKAFQTLLVLIQNRDRVVAKDELIQILWPDTFVEEVNLAQNISTLRKVLGEAPGENRFIATIPGRGYQFVCEVREIGVAVEDQALAGPVAVVALTGADADGPAPSPPVNLPPRRSVLRNWRYWLLLALVAVAVLGAAGGYWFKRYLVEQPPRSIAVLPFQPLVSGADDEHLGFGMADAVITRLSNIHQLPVRPTDVAIRYGEAGVDALKAGREMGVDAVLTGRLQKSNDRIRVTVQLVRVSDGRALWAGTFDDKYTGIFGVEDSISERVAQALAVHLASREKLQLQRHYTENIDAYRHYLLGRYEEFTFTPEGMHKAIDDFQHAITEDPGYAIAYAGLADAYTTESDWLLPPREALAKADAAARRALAFDDQLAEAHGALAHALLHEWKLAESGQEFHTAMALNPNNVSTYFGYSEYLASIGEVDEAIASMQKALRLDPLSPEINSFLGWDYYLKRDYDSCVVSSLKAMQMFPEYWLPHMIAGMCYYMRGRYPDAMREYSRAMVMNPDSTFSQAGIGMSLAKTGKRAEALKALKQLEEMQKRIHVSPAYVSLIYLALDDRDAEFAWLEKGYDDRSEWLLWLAIDPIYDGQRNDPRYKSLVRKVGI